MTGERVQEHERGRNSIPPSRGHRILDAGLAGAEETVVVEAVDVPGDRDWQRHPDHEQPEDGQVENWSQCKS